MKNQKINLISHPKQQLGFLGEQLVCSYLIGRGFSIIESNFKIQGGEIDIIAQAHSLICCVEVKTRINPHFHISQVITPSKQAHIIKAAHIFLMKKNIRLDTITLRFDVALVEHSDNPTIKYLENAFSPQESW